jgi:hypothetical protein
MKVWLATVLVMLAWTISRNALAEDALQKGRSCSAYEAALTLEIEALMAPAARKLNERFDLVRRQLPSGTAAAETVDKALRDLASRNQVPGPSSEYGPHFKLGGSIAHLLGKSVQFQDGVLIAETSSLLSGFFAPELTGLNEFLARQVRLVTVTSVDLSVGTLNAGDDRALALGVEISGSEDDDGETLLAQTPAAVARLVLPEECQSSASRQRSVSSARTKSDPPAFPPAPKVEGFHLDFREKVEIVEGRSVQIEGAGIGL